METYQSSHYQYVTRAPIRAVSIQEIAEKAQLFAAYLCRTIVTIDLDEIKDGAMITARTLMDYGNGQPLDVILYSLNGEYMLFPTNNSRSLQVVPAKTSCSSAVAVPIIGMIRLAAAVKLTLNVFLTNSFVYSGAGRPTPVERRLKYRLCAFLSSILDQLRQIAVFVTTVDHGSFRAVARALQLSPSVLSHHVTQLENMVGTALIYRSTRELSPRPDGERFLAAARIMLDAAEAGLKAVSSDEQQQPSGLLRVTMPLCYLRDGSRRFTRG